MPIKVAREPPGAESVLRRGIEELAELDALDAELSAVEELEGPFRVFTLEATALAHENPLSKARHVAWRYALIGAKGRALGFAELAIERGGLVLAQVGAAPAASAVRSALAVAKKQSQRRKEEYEARLLRFPAAYLLAIWLVPSADSAEELLIPVAPAPDVQADRAYPPRRVFDAVRAGVEKQLAHEISKRHA